MSLLQELTTENSDHVPIMEAISLIKRKIDNGEDYTDVNTKPIKENTRGGKITPKGAKGFFNANPGLVIGAAALAVGAYNKYKSNKRNTITLHAKDAYERRMMTSIVDVLTKQNKFRVLRTKFQQSGKTWVLKRVGVKV
jgi:hypothetical protein